jgi:hypothetical protein
MTLSEPLGWFAANLVFAAFCAREMAPLRAIAIASNIAFVGYRFLDHLWPIVVLHLAMLPMNAIRLRQTLLPAGTYANDRRSVAVPFGQSPRAMGGFARDARSNLGS